MASCETTPGICASETAHVDRSRDANEATTESLICQFSFFNFRVVADMLFETFRNITYFSHIFLSRERLERATKTNLGIFTCTKCRHVTILGLTQLAHLHRLIRFEVMDE